MMWHPSHALGNWNLENICSHNASESKAHEAQFCSRAEFLVGTSSFIQSGGKDGNCHTFTRGCQCSLLLFLKFCHARFRRFQRSYREFLRCDKDSLVFYSTDFYRTVDGYKNQSRHSAAVFLMERTVLEARTTGAAMDGSERGSELYESALVFSGTFLVLIHTSNP